MVTLSGRLPWTTGLNRLAMREAELRASGARIVDLTITNPTRVGLDYPERALADALGAGVGPYDPAPLGLPSARVAVAADYARRGAAVDPSCIAITASSSESYAALFKLLCDPGDAVLVPQPSYPLFDYLARLEGLDPRPYRLAYDGRWRIDWDSVDVLGARAICVVSPNNPTGSFVTGDDLRRLDELATGHGLAVIVDEVFADYALAAPPDAVRAAAAHESSALSFSLGGLSKAAGLPHMKLGWLAAHGPAARVREALAALELILDTYLSVATATQRALPRLLELGAEIRGRIQDRVRGNREALAAAVAPGSSCTLLPTEAGWAAVLRVPAVMSEEDWALALLDEGVLVQPGYFFDLALGATLVVSLLSPPEDLRAGIARILARAAA
jgi:aspartate/methionine/tyrosine aminotransferase